MLKSSGIRRFVMLEWKVPCKQYLLRIQSIAISPDCFQCTCHVQQSKLMRCKTYERSGLGERFKESKMERAAGSMDLKARKDLSEKHWFVYMRTKNIFAHIQKLREKKNFSLARGFSNRTEK